MNLFKYNYIVVVNVIIYLLLYLLLIRYIFYFSIYVNSSKNSKFYVDIDSISLFNFFHLYYDSVNRSHIY